jgi:hypothetical protein
MIGDLGTELAVSLAQRLGDVVPSHCIISAENGVLRIRLASTQSWVEIDIKALVDQSGERNQNVEAAAYSALNTVQDFVSEALAEPWPADQRGRSYMPLPHTAVDGDRLKLCYGDPKRPTVELPSISLRR